MFNLVGPEYYPIYLGLMLVLIVTKLIVKTPSGLITGYDRGSIWKSILLISFFILFFGFRPLNNYFPDSLNYAEGYEYILRFGPEPDISRGDLAFDLLRNTCAFLGLPLNAYFCVIAAFYLFPILLGARLLFPGREYLTFLFFCTCFAFYSGGGVIIRNGIACSFIFLAIALLYNQSKRNIILSALCLVVAYYFHNSAAIPIIALILSFFIVKDIKYSFWIWVICLLISLAIGRSLGYTISDIFEDERLSEYTEAGLDANNFEGFSSSGFRWDFIIYSLFGFVMIYFIRFAKYIKDAFYNLLSNTYILTNAFWILFIYAKFSDRFARLSWVLMPFLFIYPLVKYKFWISPNSTTGWILVGQWLFLLVMGISSLSFFFYFI